MNAKNANLGAVSLARAGSVCALCAALAGPAFGQDVGDADFQPVEVTDYGRVTLAVQDTDLAQVLEMLSIQSQKNIITSKNVSATISANLFDVTFYEALDAILKVNGYDYLEDGNFIYIYTQQELEEIEAASKSREPRTFEVNYLAASDAHELITPLLSEVGTSSFRGDVEPGIEPDSSNVGQDGWAYTAMLVVNDYPEVLDAIDDLLGQLDTPPKQVLIEATVLQTTLDESNAFGIDFSVLGNVNFADLTAPLSGVGNLLNGNDATSGFQPADNRALIGQSTVGQTPGAGGLKIGIVKDDFSIFLKVLDEVTNSTVLARPKIMCLNRQRAEVLVGSRVGYLSTTATETTTTQTVEFLDTGIHLMFRPFIAANGMIRLELSPSVSEASLRTITDSNGVAVTIPDELTNELTTNVRIQDGHTLVLGGLFRESTRSARRQVPFLGDIPIVGAAFRGNDDTVDRDEILFLITPSIVHDEALWAMGEDALSYSQEVQVGARMGLLPFSREKTTQNHNMRAHHARKRGDLDKALYHVNNSLRLDAMQPEMLRFRAEILGIKESPHERSIIEKVFRKELGLQYPGQVSTATPVGFGGAMPVPADGPATWESTDADTMADGWDESNDATQASGAVTNDESDTWWTQWDVDEQDASDDASDDAPADETTYESWDSTATVDPDADSAQPEFRNEWNEVPADEADEIDAQEWANDPEADEAVWTEDESADWNETDETDETDEWTNEPETAAVPPAANPRPSTEIATARRNMNEDGTFANSLMEDAFNDGTNEPANDFADDAVANDDFANDDFANDGFSNDTTGTFTSNDGNAWNDGTIDTSDDNWFIDMFIQEYFVSLGFLQLSPPAPIVNAENFMDTSATFEIVEAENEDGTPE